MEVGCQAARAGRDAVPVEVYNLDIDVSKLHRNQYCLSHIPLFCNSPGMFLNTHIGVMLMLSIPMSSGETVFT